MRKILYLITQSEFGGAQRYVFDLANNLKTEYQVAIAMGEGKNNVKLAKILQKNHLKYFIIPHLKRNISPFNDILALMEIIKLIKNYQPDVIHLNSSKISILGSIAALFAKSKIKNQKSKIFYTVHGWVFNEPLPWFMKLFYKQAEKFTARFKDKIICVSEFDRQSALKHNIAPAEKLVTIQNGLASTNLYGREEAKKIILSKIGNWKLSGFARSGEARKIGNLLIGSIGHLYKTKGFEYFIEAAYKIIANCQLPITFIIIGDGSERVRLEYLIANYDLQNNFILTGSINQAAKLLPALDIYVCSSVKEGLPYSILEAMSAGLPIVSTAVGGLPEMIKNGQTGLLVKPADPEDLAEKIKTLLNNKTLAQKLGRHAKTQAAAEFGLEKMIEKTKKVYCR
ncbi:MAG: glycosyltransferase family 4 protein [bacterium]|nr:glycosyltransferase family 4 protein [bacterium]